MELWLDTCSFSIIEEADDMGILCGVTTNPKILKSSSLSPFKTIEKLLEIQKGPVTWQVDSSKAHDIINEGKYFSSVSSRIIVKIPVTKEGLKAIHRLSKENIATMATVIFDPFQALLAFKAGALYAAPYIGRMEDARLDPFDLLKKTTSRGNILAASLRTLDHYIKCLELDCKAATINEKLFEKMLLDNPLTLKSIQEFHQL